MSRAPNSRLGQAFVGVGRAALEQASLVADRDLDLGDARVERADDRDDLVEADDVAHVLGAGLRVVDPVHGVVEDDFLGDLDLVAAGRAARFLDRELDAVDDRLGRRELAALLRELDARSLTVPLLVSPGVATAPPLAAAPLGAALEPLLLHAANARTLTAASAPILCSFIQYLLQITGRNHLAVDPRRGSEPDPRRPEPGGAGRPLGGPRMPGTVRDGSGAEARVRAARRWPPKRCRIIRHRRPECNTGRPHPVSAVASAIARRRRGERGPRWTPRSNPIEGDGSPALRGRTRRRGIPGPSGPCHGHRSARRPERRRRADAPLPGARSAAADLMRQLVYLPQASIVVAESRRVVVGGAILALRPSVRCRRLRRHDRPPGRRPGPRRGTHHRGARSRSSSAPPATRAAPSSRPSGRTIPRARARWQRMGFDVKPDRAFQRIVAAAGAAARRTDMNRPPCCVDRAGRANP